MIQNELSDGEKKKKRFLLHSSVCICSCVEFFPVGLGQKEYWGRHILVPCPDACSCMPESVCAHLKHSQNTSKAELSGVFVVVACFFFFPPQVIVFCEITLFSSASFA